MFLLVRWLTSLLPARISGIFTYFQPALLWIEPVLILPHRTVNINTVKFAPDFALLFKPTGIPNYPPRIASSWTCIPHSQEPSCVLSPIDLTFVSDAPKDLDDFTKPIYFDEVIYWLCELKCLEKVEMKGVKVMRGVCVEYFLKRAKGRLNGGLDFREAGREGDDGREVWGMKGGREEVLEAVRRWVGKMKTLDRETYEREFMIGGVDVRTEGA